MPIAAATMTMMIGMMMPAATLTITLTNAQRDPALGRVLVFAVAVLILVVVEALRVVAALLPVRVAVLPTCVAAAERIGAGLGGRLLIVGLSLRRLALQRYRRAAAAAKTVAGIHFGSAFGTKHDDYLLVFSCRVILRSIR